MTRAFPRSLTDMFRPESMVSPRAWKAIDARSGEQCLVKVLGKEFAQDAAERDRLRRELVKQQQVHAQPSASLAPRRRMSVAPAMQEAEWLAPTGLGEVEEGCWVQRSFVEGVVSLREHLASEGALSFELAAALASQIAGTLDHLHRAGLMHRDVKPGHILLRRPSEWAEDADAHDVPQVVLLDVGLPTPHETASGRFSVLGDPAYMAPEVAAGGPASFRSDLYSLGCLLFELVMGEKPFASDDIEACQHAHATEDLPPLRADTPASLTRLVQALTAKQPTERPLSARQVQQSLRPVLRKLMRGAPPGGTLTGSVNMLAAGAMPRGGGGTRGGLGRGGASVSQAHPHASSPPARIPSTAAQGIGKPRLALGTAVGSPAVSFGGDSERPLEMSEQTPAEQRSLRDTPSQPPSRHHALGAGQEDRRHLGRSQREEHASLADAASRPGAASQGSLRSPSSMSQPPPPPPASIRPSADVAQKTSLPPPVPRSIPPERRAPEHLSEDASARAAASRPPHADPAPSTSKPRRKPMRTMMLGEDVSDGASVPEVKHEQRTQAIDLSDAEVARAIDFQDRALSPEDAASAGQRTPDIDDSSLRLRRSMPPRDLDAWRSKEAPVDEVQPSDLAEASAAPPRHTLQRLQALVPGRAANLMQEAHEKLQDPELRGTILAVGVTLFLLSFCALSTVAVALVVMLSR